jgi:hypothetical protein
MKKKLSSFHDLNLQILLAMQRELANSGMSQEEILAKMMVLQKAMAGDNSPGCNPLKIKFYKNSQI